MYVLLITRLLRLVGRWARKPVNHTSWVAVVTPTDRPKSVRNRCVIELFCGVVYVVTLPFLYFCWCMGFCHRTESDLFLFLFQVFFLIFITDLFSLHKIICMPAAPPVSLDDVISRFRSMYLVQYYVIVIAEDNPIKLLHFDVNDNTPI